MASSRYIMFNFFEQFFGGFELGSPVNDNLIMSINKHTLRALGDKKKNTEGRTQDFSLGLERKKAPHESGLNYIKSLNISTQFSCLKTCVCPFYKLK